VNPVLWDLIMADRFELPLNAGPSITWLAVDPEDPDDAHLGPAMKIDKFIARLTGFIGDSPIAIPARLAAEKMGINVAPWGELRRENLRSSFVGVGFGVRSFEGFDPTAVGLELVFRDDEIGLNTRKKIHVHSLFPSAEYRVVASGEIEAGFEAGSKVEFRAPLIPPGLLGNGDSSAPDDQSRQLVFDGTAGLKAAISGKGSISLSTEVRTPVVSAMGVGDRRAYWCFFRQKASLANEDIMTWTGLLTSDQNQRLNFRARMFVIFDFRIWKFRRDSDWRDLTVEI
jgi:hypothetical protein